MTRYFIVVLIQWLYSFTYLKKGHHWSSGLKPELKDHSSSQCLGLNPSLAQIRARHPEWLKKKYGGGFLQALHTASSIIPELTALIWLKESWLGYHSSPLSFKDHLLTTTCMQLSLKCCRLFHIIWNPPKPNLRMPTCASNEQTRLSKYLSHKYN